MAAARLGKSHSAALRLNGMGYSRKIQTPAQEQGLSEDMEFRGVLKNWKWNFQGKGVQEKPMWNFYGSWFLTLEFPRGVKQFWKISSRGEVCFLSRICISLSLLETF